MRKSVFFYWSLLVIFVVTTVVVWPLAVSATNQNVKASPTKRIQSVPGEILVRFRPDSQTVLTRARTMQLKSTMSVELHELSEVTEIVSGLRLIKTSPSQQLDVLATLNSRDDVEYAEPNYIWYRDSTTPNDEFFEFQWGLKRIEAEQAWDITTGNSNVVVGVLDGGVDIGHEDLQGNIWTNPNETPMNGVDDDNNGLIDDVNGWDFHHNDNTVFDNESGDEHATHVAGIIGARGNNSKGVSGVCWNVSLLPIKVLGPTGGSVANVIAGYSYAKALRDRGVNLRVLNNSYGGPTKSLAAQDAIEQLNQSGILFVASAGNDHRDNFNFPHYPSSYQVPNVLAVAAAPESSGFVAGFSNFGERRVPLAAPGSGIASTFPGNDYVLGDGSSMAAPHAAGAAALVISAVPGISLSALKGSLVFSNAQPTTLDVLGTLNVNKAILTAQENDTTPPAPPGSVVAIPPFFGGRIGEVTWVAPGDDGNVGTVAIYELTYIKENGERIPLRNRIVPQSPGTAQSLGNVTFPMGNPTGTIELRAYDNAGNSSAATAPLTLDLNRGADPYVMSLSANAPLSTGGQRLILDGDDQYVRFDLPFNVLPGGNFDNVSVSTNGALHFTSTPPKTFIGVNDDIPSSVEYLTGQPMLAVLWDDLVVDTTLRPDAGVFLLQPNSDTVIVRWQANRFGNNEPVNFEAELRRNGTFICRYGLGNQNIRPVVGLSFGEPDADTATTHTSEYWKGGPAFNLTNAQTVTFAVRVPPPEILFHFNRNNTPVSETAGNVTISVSRPTNTSIGLPFLGSYSINYATSAGSALPNVDYVETSGTLTFDTGQGTKTFTVPILNDSTIETSKQFNVTLSNPTNGSAVGTPDSATVEIIDDDFATTNQIKFASSTLSANESAGSFVVPVTRSGNLAEAASVEFRTTDTTSNANCSQLGSSASSRCDYLGRIGTLSFLPGESSKSISVSIIDDSFQENSESLTLTLSNPSTTTIVSPAAATLTIVDNDTSTSTNPINDPAFFVRQHYLDFLNREPDAGGLNFWTNEITSCGSNTSCTEVKRINVSAAFFLSIEFQETGYLIYRMYKASYGNAANTLIPVKFNEFIRDTQLISQGLQVGSIDWQTKLETNKQAFAKAFVQRPEFLQAYPESLGSSGFVGKLQMNVGSALSDLERSGLVSMLGNTPSDPEKRAMVLRAVADDSDLRREEFKSAFVVMQYMGYLRRNPNDPPDSNLDGYLFWMTKLNIFNGNFVNAEMVKSFIISGEYRRRFGP